MVGRTLLHYEVSAQLGSGGFGRVYLAVDQRTGRKVALKFFDAQPKPDARPGDLEREARAAARLNHPGIVALYGLEHHEGEWFLVEEYVEGHDLRERLAKGRLDDLELIRLARELASALAHAHGQGVLHRDIKPANVLITSSGDYKLADFGLARIVDSSRSDSAALLGTLPYMAPERLRGHPGDGRADLFSLGAVLYEAMSGRCAFAGSSEAEVVYAVLNRAPEPLTPRSEVAHTVAETAGRLLEKEPQDRPPDAGVVVGWLTESPVAVSFARPRSSRRVRWALMSLALATLALVFSAPMWRSQEGPIAVLEFRNVVDSADPSRLGLIASNLLTSNLANSVGLSVLSAERVHEATQDLKSDPSAGRSTLVRGVADRTRAAWVVTGSILRTEPTLLMTAELSEARSGRIMEAVRVEAPKQESIFDLTDQVSRKLALKLVRLARPETLRGPRKRSTSDLIAYQRFVEGLEYLSRDELEKARIALAHAVKRDSTFDLAREQLAVVTWLMSRPYERESR